MYIHLATYKRTSGYSEELLATMTSLHPESPPLIYTAEPAGFTQREALASLARSKHYDGGYVPRHLKRVLRDNKWTYDMVAPSEDKDIYQDLNTFPDGTSSSYHSIPR
jgi:hypothetical protein